MKTRNLSSLIALTVLTSGCSVLVPDTASSEYGNYVGIHKISDDTKSYLSGSIRNTHEGINVWGEWVEAKERSIFVFLKEYETKKGVWDLEYHTQENDSRDMLIMVDSPPYGSLDKSFICENIDRSDLKKARDQYSRCTELPVDANGKKLFNSIVKQTNRGLYNKIL